jgi:hypothetical protein
MGRLLAECFLGLVFWPGIPALQVASAQTSAQNELATIASRALLLLNSPEPSNRAWGAYLVGQNDLSELEPRLRQFLDHIDEFGENEIRSILDAEIRLGTKLPPETVKMIYVRYPVEATVLFSRSPGEYTEIILPFFEETPISARWLALGDLLSEAKSPEFAKLLMRQMQRIDLSVSVVDPHSGGGTGGGCGHGIPEIKVPGDFPPVAAYELSVYPKHGALVLAPGPRPVYALRKLIAPGERAGVDNLGAFICPYQNTAPYRQEFLSSMLDVHPAEVKFDTEISLEWSNSNQFSTKVRTYCQDILNKYEHLKSLLLDKKLLSASDAHALEAHLFLKYADFRKDKARPIPEIHLDRVTVESIRTSNLKLNSRDYGDVGKNKK